MSKTREKLLIPFHPLTNFEVAEYYKNEPRFNGAYSKDNLPNNIKNGEYVINLDEHTDIGTHWVALYVKSNKASKTSRVTAKPSEVFYFDSSGIEHIPEEIINFIKNKNVMANIFSIQVYDSIMCGYYCIHFLIICLKVKV